MVKDLNHHYESPQNHGWMKIKNQYEIDGIVVQRNETKTSGVYNYWIAAGPITREHANAIKPKYVWEWRGLLFMILGKTDSTNLKLPRGAILRVAAEEVLEHDTDNPKFKRYSVYVARVIEAVPEKSVPDGLDVLARLAALSSAPRESQTDRSDQSSRESIRTGSGDPRIRESLSQDEYEKIRKEGEPLPAKYYVDQKSGVFWSQFHWRGIPEKGGNLLHHSVHCDVRMDLGLGFLVQWVLTGRLRKLKRAILGEKNPATDRLESAEAIVKPSAEPPEELLRENSGPAHGGSVVTGSVELLHHDDPDEPDSEAECHEWEIRSGSYWIAPGQVGATNDTWAYMMLIDEGEVVEGIQRRDAHEYFFSGKRFKGRYILRKLRGSREGGGEYWLFFRPTDQYPANPTEHDDEGYHFPIKPRGDSVVVLITQMQRDRANAIIDETDDVLKVSAIVTREGVFKGVYRPAEVLEKSYRWLLGVPVTVSHPQDGVCFDEEAVGQVMEVSWEPPNVRVVAELWKDRLPPAILQRIRNGEPVDVSVGYYPIEEAREGEFQGEKYDRIETSLFFDHVAIVPQGACSWEDGCGIRKHEEVIDLDQFDFGSLSDVQLQDYYRKAFAWWCSRKRGIEIKFTEDQIKRFLTRLLEENKRRGNVFEPHPERLEDCARELWDEIRTHELVLYPSADTTGIEPALKLEDVLSRINDSATIRAGIVHLVGGLAANGVSNNDADFLIKFHSLRESNWDGLCDLVARSSAPDNEKSMINERIRQIQQEILDEIVFPIEHRIRRAFPPEMQRRISIFLDEYNGPFTRSIPIWDLVCVPAGGAEMAENAVQTQQPTAEQTDAQSSEPAAHAEIMTVEDLEKVMGEIEKVEDEKKKAEALMDVLKTLVDQAKSGTGLFAGPTMYPYPKYPYPKYPYPHDDTATLEWDTADDPETAKSKIAEGIQQLLKLHAEAVRKIHQDYEAREKSELIDRISRIAGHSSDIYRDFDVSALRTLAQDFERISTQSARTQFKIDDSSTKRDVKSVLDEFEKRRKRS
ncbi:MAG: DUF2213 domain-containing protein [Methanothrix sp.]|nr:DUF2213 domain-containing protein [Methanothrix sp.]MCX8207424.1 DUF2213 domain-containing protein [Methanothrix sp.]